MMYMGGLATSEQPITCTCKLKFLRLQGTSFERFKTQKCLKEKQLSKGNV